MTNLARQGFFERIFREYHSLMFAFAMQYVKNQEDARDLVQDVFLNIWKRIGHLEERGNIRAYLFTAMRNKCIDFLKARSNVPADIDEVRNIPADSSNSDLMLEEAELRAVIFSEVQKLPPKCKEIFILSRQKEFSNKEIATHLGISIKTVENQMTIALKRVTRAVEDYSSVPSVYEKKNRFGREITLFGLFTLGVLIFKTVL